ncbi:MAG TPA: SDR family oxidoreductase [Pyrinomonadaceae bacterium]|nr:SDR family oxidoreductase [Pyrinomonadaceae bacterium]
MRVLVLGGSGMLGHKLVQRWGTEFDVWATLRGEFARYERFGIFDRAKTVDSLSVLDTPALEAAIERVRPDVIFNAVGIVKQVPSAKNSVATLQINSVLPHQLADIASKVDARFIQISTDCVFNGERGMYSEDDEPNATDLYGKSKNLGEVVGENCLTLRTSIIGRELETGHGLVEWVLSNRGTRVRGFANAIFSGFPTIVLADIISNLIRNHPTLSGLYHVSSEPINKFDLLNLIKTSYKIDLDIERFEDFRIDRSLDSTKFKNATGFQPSAWSEMVAAMANDETPYDSWRSSTTTA